MRINGACVAVLSACLSLALIDNRAGAQTPPATSASAEGPRWKAAETSYDFGHAWAGAILRYPFKFQNVGNQTLKILEAKPKCACSVAEDYTREVPPGGTGVIPFTLNTQGKAGHVAESLTIKTNDASQPDMVLELKGQIKVVCDLQVIADDSVKDENALSELRPTGGNFGKVKGDQKLHRVIRMTNRSGAPLSLRLVPIVNSERFKAELKETKTGEEFELSVFGEPPWPTGYSSAQVNFKTNIPDQEYFQVNLFAYCPARVEVVPQRIVLDPKYPTVLKRTIRIMNNGASPLEISALSSSNPAFSLRMMPPRLDEPGTHTISLQLPQDYRPPEYGDVVRINTTDREKAQIDIYVLPSLEKEPAPRPADKPLQFYPGKLK